MFPRQNVPPDSRLWWFFRLVLIVSLMLVSTPSRAHGAGDTPPVLRLEACTVQGVKAECGTLMVYENRLTQTGRQIPVYVVVVRARERTATPANAMFFFAGGPGGAASDLVNLYSRLWFRYNRNGDLVFVDQRGVGQSNPLKCVIDTKLDTPTIVDRCLDSLEADPGMYTTAMYVEDVEDVRRALGYETISIDGGSYGGTVAQVYLNRYGEHVRSAILDHTTLITIPFFPALARNSQLALDQLFVRCASDSRCAQAYPDLRAEWTAIREYVASTPVTTTVLHPYTSQPIVIDALTLAGSVHQFLFFTDQTVALPLAIHTAYSKRDYTAFARMQVGAAHGRQAGLGLVMYGIIMCTEAWTGATAQPEEVTRLGGGSYYLDAALASMAEFRTTCPLLPRSAASQHGQPVVRDVPVLVLVGDIDPQNPLPNMQGVTDWYPQAQIVIEPGQGHATLNTRCRTDLVNNFAIDPAKPLDTSCLETGLLLFARP